MIKKRGRVNLSVKEISQLMNVASGKEKADMAVVNANLVNVYTGELLPNYSVAVKGERIAYVGPKVEPSIGPETRVIDAGGKALIPGLIDAHTHLIFLFLPSEFVPYAVRGGTTSLITETQEITFAVGFDGCKEYIASLRDQPIKMFATLPPLVTISPTSEEFALTPGEMRKLLREPDVVGMGETYWAPAVQGNKRLIAYFRETLMAGKVIEGHSAGAKDEKLMAYVAGGVSSCHEPITIQEVIDRLRLGLHVPLRHGSIRKDIGALIPLLKDGKELRRVMMCTDGVDPKDLARYGYMEWVVQEAINAGLEPIKAIQMATLNAAEHFALDNIIGGIAPGKCADMVLIPDINTIKAQLVISNGRIVSQNGQILVQPRKHNFPDWIRQTFKLPRPLTAADFAIKVGEADGRVKVRVIDYVTDLVTREAQEEVPVSKGFIAPDTNRDLLKAAAIDRLYRAGQMAVALVRGFKMKKGAFASSGSWDCAAISVVGANDADMALAVNRLAEIQGGIILAADGKIIHEVPLPIGGFLSELPMEIVANQLNELRRKLGELGCTLPDPHLSLTLLTTAAIPHLRLSEYGLVNLRDGKSVELVVK